MQRKYIRRPSDLPKGEQKTGGAGSPSLTIAIIGSTGKAGGWVLDEALARGHTVRCLARKPAKLADAGYGKKIHCIKGDATNVDDLKEVISGADVVVSTVGSPSKECLIVEQTAKALVAAFEGLGTWCHTHALPMSVED